MACDQFKNMEHLWMTVQSKSKMFLANGFMAEFYLAKRNWAILKASLVFAMGSKGEAFEQHFKFIEKIAFSLVNRNI